MKKLLLLLILSFFLTQGFSGECPDGSEPTRSVSADGSYYVYKCDNNSNDDANNTSTSSSSSSSSNIPANAYASSSDTKGWKCKSGYYQNNNNCLKLPSNAYASTYGYGFLCNSGYIKSGNSCIKRGTIPHNAYASGAGWECKYGYAQYGYSCIKKSSSSSSSSSSNIPAYAHSSGDSWTCNTDYYKSGSRCLRVPKYAYSPYTNNDFFCNPGFIKYGDTCLYKNDDSEYDVIPPNAYVSGSGWKCNSGYTKSGNSCIKNLEDDKVYSAASGSGFAVTSDGYVITNYHVIEGCTDVKIHDKGKSILATLVTFDPNNDIALLKGDFKPKSFYPLSRETPKLLTEIYVAGHPFGQAISTSVKVTKGIISSLSGIANNFSNLLIDAALQPGNSGGPIMNDKGNVIGVAVAKLDFATILDEFDTIPENVNFGVKANVVINILESENIKLPTPNINTILTSELGELITDGTYYLSCWMTVAQIEKMLETKVMFSNLT